MPTYIATGILISCKLNFPHIAAEVEGFDVALEKGLLASTGRGFQGHGHDNLDGLVKALNVFITAKVHIYLEKFPDTCKEFTKLFNESIAFCENSLLTGNTKGDWGEDYSAQYRCILQSLYPHKYLKLEQRIEVDKEEVNVFVYGTLMKSNRNGMTYLKDAKCLGEATLEGYELYDLGSFPGIVQGDGKVKGEVYTISVDKLPELDRYEGEGSLYKRNKVEVYSEESKEKVNCYVYVYNRSTTGRPKVEYKYQPWHEGVVAKMNDDNLVWYATYGSNVNKERFMKYIEGCSDTTPPKKERPIIIDHELYFANRSGRWDSRGVAFLDLGKEGKTYGKMYLITEEQFKEIQQQEGPTWYDGVGSLGFKDGIAVKTLTHSTRFVDENIPCKAYFNTIKQGIRSTYPTLSEEEIDAYLLGRCLDRNTVEVLQYIRKQQHGVRISKICNHLNKNDKMVVDSLSGLRELGLVVQDSRSVREGVAPNSAEAVYYTVRSRRAAIDMVVGRSK
ncbi:gamma-glutamylcyclotransferase [Alkalicella caledoniensis]|uniref:Putative gamma-glutamylcyclotransferase n=2 Tax=Alkalicella caledoniensis TaxID=2731377 RepID=A0A7G9WDF6_ALKCA|nr:gamma-glutamylcyclotransferase [Alkalicella caledoniensis]